MARTSTYLNFPRQTEEAFLFYKSVFGGEFLGDGINRFGDIPTDDAAPPMPEEDKKWINPLYLRNKLFVGKESTSPNRVYNIVLNPYEYRLIIRARDPIHIRNEAIVKTIGFDRPNEEVLARAERSGKHTLEGKIESMSTHLGNLEWSGEMLSRLMRRAWAPGRAHETDANLVELYANAWREFENMLDVVHVAERWTDSERDRADTAFLYNLTQGDQVHRVRQWRSMLSLAQAYVNTRSARFGEKIEWAQETLSASKNPISLQDKTSA